MRTAFEKIRLSTAHLIVLFIAFSFQVEAQPNNLEDRIEAQRVAFITQRVNLTPTEAQSFWPLYNEYRTSLSTLRAQRITPRDLVSATDAQAEEELERMLTNDQAEIDLKREYTSKFRKVLSARKILMIIHADQVFKERLLKAIRQRGVGSKRD